MHILFTEFWWLQQLQLPLEKENFQIVNQLLPSINMSQEKLNELVMLSTAKNMIDKLDYISLVIL